MHQETRGGLTARAGHERTTLPYFQPLYDTGSQDSKRPATRAPGNPAAVLCLRPAEVRPFASHRTWFLAGTFPVALRNS